ncbi:hypothetical protein SDC9_109633 [bioreactor metagenome]|uniref:DUF3408 domain-containing protein n=1 Tax=bioreactor metagenome TaxID=1076179 RepID=A0A645BCD5_9ZZZZ
MIPNPIIYNDTTITIGLIVSCLVMLAAVMIPKAIKYRKQVKQNESEKAVQDEQEVEITIISEEKMKKKEQTLDYRKTFLTAPKLEDRKPVFISRETRDSLDKIARRLGDRKMSVSGFLENMAKHHLAEYKDEVNRLYEE